MFSWSGSMPECRLVLLVLVLLATLDSMTAYTDLEKRAITEIKRYYPPATSLSANISVLCAFFVNYLEGNHTDIHRRLEINFSLLRSYCDIAVLSGSCVFGTSIAINKIAIRTGATFLLHRCLPADRVQNLTFVPKQLLYDRLLGTITDYTYIWLLDDSITLEDFDVPLYFQTLACASTIGIPPLLSQPLIRENTNKYPVFNAKTWVNSSAKVIATEYIDIQSTVIEAQYFDWYVRSILTPYNLEHSISSERGLDNIMCKSALLFASHVHGALINATSTEFYPCAVITIGNIAVHQQLEKTRFRNHQFFDNIVTSNELVSLHYPTLYKRPIHASSKIGVVIDQVQSPCLSIGFAPPRRSPLLQIRKHRGNNTEFIKYISSNPKPSIPSPKLYAWYFPQFHRDTLNDKLWGRGFTDWDSLSRLTFLKRGIRHYPFPTELGYYDLLNVTTRRKQAELARMYGIDGFIYHHYFFYEKGLGATLASPLEALLKDNEPDLPFALHWANLNWTVTWQGSGFKSLNGSLGYNAVLQSQNCPNINDKMVVDHYSFLHRFFLHRNYIKINGVPLLFVYRDHDEACMRIVERFRVLAMKDGFPRPGLHVPQFNKNIEHPTSIVGKKPRPGIRYNVPKDKRMSAAKYIRQRIVLESFQGDLYYPGDHKVLAHRIPSECYGRGTFSNETRPAYLSVITAFDNSPRRTGHDIEIWDRSWINLPPSVGFERDLVETMLYDMCCQNPKARELGGKFVTINAWNEWAEGMVLEPSSKYGRSFLEAVLSAKKVVEAIQCDMKKLDKYIKSM